MNGARETKQRSQTRVRIFTAAEAVKLAETNGQGAFCQYDGNVRVRREIEAGTSLKHALRLCAAGAYGSLAGLSGFARYARLRAAISLRSIRRAPRMRSEGAVFRGFCGVTVSTL